jgi:predicted peptidase
MQMWLGLGVFFVLTQFSQAALVDSMQAREYTTPGSNKKIVYRLFIPKNYDKNKSYPIMVHLHGAGERGSDNKNQLNNGISSLWARDSIQAKYPSFLLAPQCPSINQWVDTDWGKGSYTIALQNGQPGVKISIALEAVVAILDSLEKEFNLDKSRYYASGLSMGGYGTWDLITRYPERFAAAVPICGAGDPTKASRIAKIPLYIFHGDADATVPVAGSREMVAAIKTAGASPTYKEIKGRGHDSWVDAENEKGLADWVFAQSLAPATIAIRKNTRSETKPNTELNDLDILGRINLKLP